MNQMTEIIPESMPQPAVIAHAQAAHNLLCRSAARTVGNCIGTAELVPQMMNLETWEELLQMQSAITERLQQQNEAWFKGVARLMKDYAQLKRANTMTKLFEQQFNIMGQWGQLLSVQTTNLMNLQENIEVDFGYWVAQKVHPQLL